MKAGYKTTEFWVTTLAILGLVASSIGSVLPANFAGVAVAIAAAAYAISRGLAKNG